MADTEEKKLSDNKKRVGMPVVVLFVIILLQTVYLCICFSTERKGIYSDEIWCYGLANSHYKPFIYAPDGYRANYIDDNDLSDNFNEVVRGSELHDYITVQRGERFDFASVYHNQTLDCHPVLYYLLLNTICSFFPDTFSLLFAFIPSIIFLCITQIYLYRLSLALTRSQVYSLGICLFYAVIPASLFTFIYLRMYSLLTMLLVMNAFYTMRFVIGGEFTRKNMLPVFVTAFLAFNTQYSSIAFIGFMTFAVCVYLLVKKGFGKAAVYGSVMLGTLLLFSALFPAFYDHIFNNQFTGEKHYGLVTQLRSIFGYITRYSLGFHVNLIRSSAGYYVIAVLVLLTALTVPVLFLLRDTAPIKKLRSAAKDKAASIAAVLKSSAYCPVMLFAGVCGIILFVDLSCDITYTREGTVRYLMPCFPFVCLLTVMILRLAAENLPLLRKAALPLLTVIVGVIAYRTNCESRTLFMYDLFPTTVSEAAEFFADSKNVVVIPEKRFIMTNTSAYLYKCDSVYYVTAKDMKADASPVVSAMPDADHVWVEMDNYLLTERQRDSLIEKGILKQEQAGSIKLLSELEADTEHELFTDEIRERLLNEEVDRLTGSDPDAELMIEANGRVFYILKSNRSDG